MACDGGRLSQGQSVIIARPCMNTRFSDHPAILGNWAINWSFMVRPVMPSSGDRRRRYRAPHNRYERAYPPASAQACWPMDAGARRSRDGVGCGETGNWVVPPWWVPDLLALGLVGALALHLIPAPRRTMRFSARRFLRPAQVRSCRPSPAMSSRSGSRSVKSATLAKAASLICTFTRSGQERGANFSRAFRVRCGSTDDVWSAMTVST
jgi:hypothetical protein